jgi:DNA polymerase III subunit delta'
MDVAEAYSLISRAIDSGHAAHGYLIVGDVRGNGSELVRRILLKLFPDATAQVESGSHPDVATLEPEGKARIISVESMRERIVAPMSTTAFSGGWKVGVIYGADRLRAEAANAFLKSLEEPTPQTLYLMVTDQPDGILPTIVSRAQRIDLPLPAGLLEGEALAEVSKAFAAKDAAALVEKLKELKDEADDADVPLVRKTFFKTLLSFARQMMLAGKLPRHQAFRNIEAIEDAYRQSDRANMSDDMVISFLLDRIVFP